ncbi:MLV-related proviral Env polyprotein-like [Lepus europaeus]|uniref:MLV-related proviral Env polyprotein-like n=1 Tax=Lepus europaeus TaxID=9983 RepID=UPI002B49712E|nr:MLV-related proviral Env polyprotein-like [Lepus europaeus]
MTSSGKILMPLHNFYREAAGCRIPVQVPCAPTLVPGWGHRLHSQAPNHEAAPDHLTNSKSQRIHHLSPRVLCKAPDLRIGVTVAIALAVFVPSVSIIICFTRSCCCLYKMCRRPRPVVVTTTTHSKTPRDKTILPILLLVFFFSMVIGSSSPHTPYQITWRLINLRNGVTVNSSSSFNVLSDFFPDLYFDLCQLFDAEDICVWKGGTYACPGGKNGKSIPGCGGPEVGYCGAWGCETTGSAYWKPSSSWDMITIGAAPGITFTECGGRDCSNCLDGTMGRCHLQVLRFTDKGKQDKWVGPKSWGIYLYRPAKDPFALFALSRTITVASVPVGPNKILTKHKSPTSRQFKKGKPHGQVLVRNQPSQMSTNNQSRLVSPTPAFPNKHVVTAPPFPSLPKTENRLLSLIHGAYQALNNSDSDRTQDCWMCLASPPPYYEGVAVIGNWTNHTTVPPQCSNLPSHRLTLTEVSGRGLCVGSVPLQYQGLCNKTMTLKPGAYYLTGPDGVYWACNTGLTPCLAGQAHNQTHEWCIMVEVWPRVTIHNSEEVYRHYEGNLRLPREPVSITLALILGGLTVGGIGAGIGTGATALSKANHYHQLQQAMHLDLQALEESVSALEKSLTSLSEVVLQNRRGLDLLFLKEGGLCAALKEECCFYADHTGVVRDSMAKLRERLKQRQSQFEAGQSWFQSWFNSSPWLTTLISSIAGPLVILLLILTIGPCILNRLVQFVNDRLSVTHALILTQQHQSLKSQDIENRF